jgi:hypothetical protein
VQRVREFAVSHSSYQSFSAGIDEWRIYNTFLSHAQARCHCCISRTAAGPSVAYSASVAKWCAKILVIIPHSATLK